MKLRIRNNRNDSLKTNNCITLARVLIFLQGLFYIFLAKKTNCLSTIGIVLSSGSIILNIYLFFIKKVHREILYGKVWLHNIFVVLIGSFIFLNSYRQHLHEYHFLNFVLFDISFFTLFYLPYKKA